MEETPKPNPPLRVGLTYNLKRNHTAGDEEAEYDSMDTILAIKDALEGDGCQVELLEATAELPQKLSRGSVDIVFNIAEGTHGRGREAQVPAILSYLQIPCTGSDETTLCIALDKALTKRLLQSHRIPTPKYQILSRQQPHLKGRFIFPAIVKPNTDGSSKGISDCSIAENREQLEALVAEKLRAYGQDILVEEYIDGREFTVGILGNGNDIRVFPPMEIIYLDADAKYPIYSFNVKQNYQKFVQYTCPAEIDEKTQAELMDTSKKIYQILECRDFARIDYRLSRDGRPYFIEINPLPGLAPGYSDFPMIAEFNGIDYVSLVRSLLGAAAKRCGLAYGVQKD